jgi:hypothetical protein
MLVSTVQWNWCPLVLILLVYLSVKPLTIMEEHALRVFDKMVLRRIFRPMSEKVTGGKLHDKELHNLYF